MKIRILQSIATSSRAFMPDEVVDVEERLAKSWIQSGVAEAFELKNKRLEPPEVKEEIDSKVDNTTDNRASKSRRGKGVPKS